MKVVGAPAPAVRQGRSAREWLSAVGEQRWTAPVLGAIGILIVGGLLQAAVASGLIPESQLPLPTTIVSRLVDLMGQSSFWSGIARTVSQSLEAMAIGTAIAVPIGAALGSNDVAWHALRPTIEFLRPMPAIALIPLVTLIWGDTGKSVVILGAFTAVWPVLMQAIYGVREVDNVARDAAVAYGLGPARRVLRLVIPSALPFLATGVRIAVSGTLIIAVTIEYLSGAPGLGSQLALAEQAGNTQLVYALALAAGLVGLVINLVLIGGQAKFMPWTARGSRTQ